MEPARGESCSSGQRRGPAALGKDKLSHPRIRNPAMYLQLQQTGDENGDSLGRYRSARCGSPNRIGWLPIDWGSWSQHVARVSPQDNVEVPPDPRRTIYHPRIRNASMYLQLRQNRDENADLPGLFRSARCGNPNRISRLLIGWGSWSPRAASVSHRDNVEVRPHPGRIGYYPRIINPSISLQLTPTNGGRKQRSPGSIPPRAVWKPQPHWLVARWLGLMEPARGEGCPSGQRRGHAAPGEGR